MDRGMAKLTQGHPVLRSVIIMIPIHLMHLDLRNGAAEFALLLKQYRLVPVITHRDNPAA
jgi:hypothetical protein